MPPASGKTHNMDAWTCRQYDKMEDKLDEAAAILDELYRDQKTTFENRPIHWQRSEAGQAELVRLLVVETLIDELHDAAGTISPVRDDMCEPMLTPRPAQQQQVTTLKP